MDRIRKGTHLNDLGRNSHVTQRGIAKLLTAVKRDEIPEAFSERTQYRDRKRFAMTKTPHGKLVEREVLHLTDGAQETIGIQSPLAFFYQSLVDCAGFRLMVQRAIANNGLETPMGSHSLQ